MNGPPRFLTFAWWNLHDFAHYDAARCSDKRWPKLEAHYEAKKRQVFTAFEQVFRNELPDLLAVCEITREAAQDLVNELGSDFSVAVSPRYPYDDGFQVAVFFRKDIGFSREPLLIPPDNEDIAEGTRPMIPLHFTLPGHVIRFIGCHWTAFDLPASRLARERLADVLRRDTYAFLEPEVSKPGTIRHVVVLGDLNEEPMSTIFDERFIGRRDRESSRTAHWRDEKVKRIRLYNAAWRYLGEQTAHGAAGPHSIGAAGTYFKAPGNWRTFDHVFVSCGLLGSDAPYLDEAHTRVVSSAIMLDKDGLPSPFEPGRAQGVSDHLPIVGRLVL